MVTSGLSNRVLFLRSGLVWLLVKPTLVSISILLSSDLPALLFKRGFLGLSFLGPLEVDSTGLERLFLAFSGSGVDASSMFD